jgi:hypothetical protein
MEVRAFFVLISITSIAVGVELVRQVYFWCKVLIISCFMDCGAAGGIDRDFGVGRKGRSFTFPLFAKARRMGQPSLRER